MPFYEYTEYSVKITATFGDYVGDTKGPVGPFNLYSNLDGFSEPFEINIPRGTLLSGYTSHVVPRGTSIIRIKTDCWDCKTYTDAYLGSLPPATPSATPTISVTPSITVTPTISISPTLTPSISVTPTITPSLTVTPSPTVSIIPMTGGNVRVVLGQSTDEVCQKVDTTVVYISTGYLYQYGRIFYDSSRTIPVYDYKYIRDVDDNQIYQIATGVPENPAVGKLYKTNKFCPGLNPKLWYFIQSCTTGKYAYTQGVPEGYFGFVSGQSSDGITTQATVFKATSDGSYWLSTGGSTNSGPSGAQLVNVELYNALGPCPS